jgi:snRNA-activating protein complex subunit 3
VFVTVYDRLSWGHKLLSRSSQHVLLSTHTLGDMFDGIPCPSNEIPENTCSETGGTWGQISVRGSSGSVICLEDVAYGDGQSEEDYAEYVRLHMPILFP